MGARTIPRDAPPYTVAAKRNALLLLTPIALAAHPPEFDPPRGLYDAPVSVALLGEPTDSIVYDRGPGTAETTYDGPIDVPTTTVVRARSIDAYGEASERVVHTYVFPADVMASAVMDPAVIADPAYGPDIEDSLWSLPTVSVTGDLPIDLTEREVTFEWIPPDGPSTSVRSGGKKVGNASVYYAKFNIRLYFRADYGTPKLELDLFRDFATGVPPADRHDALNLRSGSHDSVFYLLEQGQYLRNRWMDETQLEMGHIAPHGRYGHVYLDGSYHGVFHFRERFNAAFLAEYLGGQEEDYEAINGDSVTDGTGAAWAQVVANSYDYEAVQAWLDVDNLLDYMVLNYYAANSWDWLSWHNWMAAGPIEPDQGGFVFHSSDSDICLVYEHTTNILYIGGPDDVFFHLLAEGHPDFLVRWACSPPTPLPSATTGWPSPSSRPWPPRPRAGVRAGGSGTTSGPRNDRGCWRSSSPGAPPPCSTSSGPRAGSRCPRPRWTWRTRW